MAEEEVWGGVTDPARHDDGDFRYLIHAFNPFAKASMAMVNVQAALSKMERGENHEIDKVHGDQTINLYEQPERVAERVSLSMSLIDQDHRGTWGDAGIIVEAPKKNILITSPEDVGSMNSDPDFLRKQALRHLPYDGNGLLQVSSPLSYNEVVALANVDDSKLQLKGVFYKVTRKGEPIDPSVAQKMEMHARRLGIPVIRVKAIGHYQANEVQEGDGKLAVHLDGSRYLLGGYGDSNFRVYDEKMGGNFVTTDELKPVLQFLRDKGFGDDRIGQIERDHALADREYHRAQFEFDEKGEIKGLSKREGYGKSEQKYSVSFAGYAHVVSVEDETRRIQDSMMGNGMTYGDEYDIYRSVTRRQVEAMIEEAKEGVSPEQLAKIEEWAAKILPDVEQKSQQNYGRRNRFGNEMTGFGAEMISFVDYDFSKWQRILETRLDGGEIFRGGKRTEPKPRDGGWAEST